MKYLSGILAAISLSMLGTALCGGDGIRAVYDGKSDVKAWQTDARKKLAKVLGYDQLLAEPACDLAPETLWKRKMKYGTIEKVRIHIDPKFATSLYICIPHKTAAPHKVFICLQGCSAGMHLSIGVDKKDEKTPIKVKGDLDFAVYCMKKGISVICFEQRAQGENGLKTKRNREPCRQPSSQAVIDGRSMIGYRVFDIKRLLDYIKSRPDFFDSSKIGIVGDSSGGTTAMFAGAMLPELTHVMPSGCFSTYESSICRRAYCFCNYVTGLMIYGKISDVAGLIAPRPLVIVTGKNNRRFPLPGAKSEFRCVEQIYKNIGAGDKCKLVVGPQGIRFYADQAWKAMLPLWNNN